jgi:iron complex outermembrane receptor protein
MQGAELELRWRPADSFSMHVNYTKLDTEYDEFVIPNGADFSGNELQTSPDSSYAVGFDVRLPLAGGALTAGANYSWQADYYTGASNERNFLIDSWSLVDANVGYETNDGTWRIDLWGKNLADEEYVRIRGTVGAIAEYFGPPRTYGLSVSYRL